MKRGMKVAFAALGAVPVAAAVPQAFAPAPFVWIRLRFPSGAVTVPPLLKQSPAPVLPARIVWRSVRLAALFGMPR